MSTSSLTKDRNVTQSPEEIADLLCNSFVRLEYNISFPSEIIGIIIAFYLQVFTFNQEKHGDFLQFINETTIKKLPPSDRWSLCSIGDPINSDTCTIFKITYKWAKMAPVRLPSIGIGFISSVNLDKWNVYIGGNSEELPVFGIEIDAPDYRSHGYDYVSTTSTRNRFVNENDTEFHEGDEFSLEYDFDAKSLTIYHGMKKEHTVQVDENVMQIIPAVSLFDAGDTVEIVGWSFTR